MNTNKKQPHSNAFYFFILGHLGRWGLFITSFILAYFDFIPSWSPIKELSPILWITYIIWMIIAFRKNKAGFRFLIAEDRPMGKTAMIVWLGFFSAMFFAFYLSRNKALACSYDKKYTTAYFADKYIYIMSKNCYDSPVRYDIKIQDSFLPIYHLIADDIRQPIIKNDTIWDNQQAIYDIKNDKTILLKSH